MIEFANEHTQIIEQLIFDFSVSLRFIVILSLDFRSVLSGFSLLHHFSLTLCMCVCVCIRNTQIAPRAHFTFSTLPRYHIECALPEYALEYNT